MERTKPGVRLGSSRFWNGSSVPTSRAGSRFHPIGRKVIAIRPTKDYGVGRVCMDEGCGTILTRYHKGSLCYVHDAA